MSIALGEVLFPLRYDVWSRAHALAALSHLCNDVPALLEAGRDTVIYRHHIIGRPVYEKIGLVKVLAGPALRSATERHYVQNMTKLAKYYLSIQRRWKASRRLFYKRVVHPTVTSAGNPVPPGLFLNNGQHRTVVLLALGYTELPGSIANISEKSGKVWQPLDMTYAYIQAGECTEEKFVDFARFRFSLIPEEVVRVDDLFTWASYHHDWLCDYINIYWGQS